jgi:predicted nucleic acid-binding protein
MFVLDTNVISDIVGPNPSERLLNWLNAQEGNSLFISTIVLAELYFGAFLVREPVRRERLMLTIERIRGEFDGRVLNFGDAAAEQYGRVTAARRSMGRPIETKDAMIAAKCLVHDATLVTRNVRDFEQIGLKVVNPFEAGA